MKPPKTYLAIDLGAGSGRVLAGRFDGAELALDEVHRFGETGLELPAGYFWNVPKIYENILEGIRRAGESAGEIRSIGIDTWGVDYGLLDERGRLLGLPYQYRDSRTDSIEEELQEKLGREAIYEATGIQFLFLNTINQLVAEERNGKLLEAAQDLLFMPDLFGFLLTGERRQERTIASTSQLFNVRESSWSEQLLGELGLPAKLFRAVGNPGTELGKLLPHVQRVARTGPLPVVSVCGHDTASAVLGVPALETPMAYLSSGTWSLMGLELAEPVITREALDDGFTNELGYGGTVRFLKNISGLWLIQECRRAWAEAGHDVDYGELGTMARAAEPFRSLVDPDHPDFAKPGRMPEKIAAYCHQTGQPAPEQPGQYARCVYESLALKYRTTWASLGHHVAELPRALNVVGGGCQEALLNQLTADALQVAVEAGPVEATGLGNVMAQMIASGDLAGVEEGRAIIRKSFPRIQYEPGEGRPWEEAAERMDGCVARAPGQLL